MQIYENKCGKLATFTTGKFAIKKWQNCEKKSDKIARKKWQICQIDNRQICQKESGKFATKKWQICEEEKWPICKEKVANLQEKSDNFA